MTHRTEVKEEVPARGGFDPLVAMSGRPLQYESQAAALQRASQRQLQHLCAGCRTGITEPAQRIVKSGPVGKYLHSASRRAYSGRILPGAGAHGEGRF